jgi:hypothetical protein
MQEEDIWQEFEQWKTNCDLQETEISLVVIDSAANLAWFAIGVNEIMFMLVIQDNAIKVIRMIALLIFEESRH